MKVVVAGATGRIRSRSVTRLRDHGAQVVPLSRALGVDVGDALALRRALRGAQILVDVTDASWRQQDVSTAFFAGTTRSLLMAAREAGVEHYVALSAVGADRVASGYLRAKAVQEGLVRRSALPCSLVRATPFFESVESAVCAGLHADGVRVAPLLLRPVAADDVAAALAHVAVAVPLFGVLEAIGPEERSFEDLAANVLAAQDRVTPVIGDAQSPFFGALIGERTLLPGPDAHLGRHTMAQGLTDR
ncbi:NAD(P)H-binding protein [Streptomyces sp. NBC_00490]|uniref:SDR family oxidoreductase n=1 Tax=Streptomyces sp. NBC_00490 TaxID=2903657 RepID=UPI002E1992E3